MSTYSSTSETNRRSSSHVPMGQLHPQHAPQTYNVDSCVNCGHRYDYEKLKYESGGDGKMLWKRFSSVVSDHYSSCPNKFANIQPTSAIRGTLFERNEGSWKDARNAGTSFRFSPYSRNLSRQDRNLMETGRPSVDHHPSALPEASFINPRPQVPLAVESSRLTADHRYTLSKRTEQRFDDRDTEAQKMCSRDRSQLLPPLRQVIAQSSGQSIAIARPDSLPVAPTCVLPPNFDRKRKRVQPQEIAHGSSPPLLSTAANARPHIILYPPVHRYVSPSVSPALEAMADPRTSIDMEAEWEKLSATKVKKNVMDWRVRRGYLLQDPLLSDVEAKRVKCGPCHKWIKLDARNDYYPGLWLKHRRTMHGNTAASSPYSSSTRRKRSKPVQEDLQQSEKRDAGGSRVYQDHNQPRRASRVPISARLRSNPSNMRITRSFSGSSI